MIIITPHGAADQAAQHEIMRCASLVSTCVLSHRHRDGSNIEMAAIWNAMAVKLVQKIN